MDVYLFQARAPVENARRVFLQYMRAINQLKEHPQFYNTLTTNCTNVILVNTRVNLDHLPFSWKILLSGYTPEYVYEAGRLDRSLPFEALRRRSHINAVAHASRLDWAVKRLDGVPGVRRCRGGVYEKDKLRRPTRTASMRPEFLKWFAAGVAGATAT